MITISDDSWIAVHSRNNPPAAYAEDGDLVEFLTRDCYNRSVTEESMPIEIQTKGQPDNPSTGPLYVQGAEPGDVLAVDVLDIEVADHGVVAVGCGPFQEEGPEEFHILKIRDGEVNWKGVPIPVDPMIGVIGTAMEDRDVPTMRAFPGGGNMDCRLIKKGARVYLPVRVSGALLSIGDVHAVMGDGEVDGTGLEVDGRVLVRVRILKGFELHWPVVETVDAWYVNTCGDTCDEAIRAGYLELRRLLAIAHGWSLSEAGIYMTLQCRLSCNQACLEPRDTFRTGVPKIPGQPGLLPLL